MYLSVGTPTISKNELMCYFTSKTRHILMWTRITVFKTLSQNSVLVLLLFIFLALLHFFVDTWAVATPQIIEIVYFSTLNLPFKLQN